MIWIAGIIMFFIIIGALCSAEDDKDKKKEQKRIDADPNYVPLANRKYIHGEYIGGLSNLVAPVSMSIELFPEYLLLKYNDKEIKIDKINIKSIEVMTKQQIESQVGLGKLLVFGVLAFGMKKKKEVIENYLVLKYKDCNEEKNIILGDCENNRIQECIDYYEKHYIN